MCWSVNHCTIYAAANSAEITSWLILRSWPLHKSCALASQLDPWWKLPGLPWGQLAHGTCSAMPWGRG